MDAVNAGLWQYGLTLSDVGLAVVAFLAVVALGFVVDLVDRDPAYRSLHQTREQRKDRRS